MMAANGISTLATKQARQVAKLTIAQAKRRGQIVANTGAISGSANSSQPFYRTLNTYDLTLLPTQYSGNLVVDNANAGGLINGRPWT
jgi:hypothetical protein